jgi:hypothetical protein
MAGHKKKTKVAVISNILLAFLGSLCKGTNNNFPEKLASMLLAMGLWGFSFKTAQFEFYGDYDRTTYSEALKVLGELATYEQWLLNGLIEAIKKEARRLGVKMRDVYIIFDDTICVKKKPRKRAKQWIAARACIIRTSAQDRVRPPVLADNGAVRGASSLPGSLHVQQLRRLAPETRALMDNETKPPTRPWRS